MAQFLNPEDSHTPVAPLRVLLEKGLDPRKVKCCAIAEEGKVVACPAAAKCQKLLREHAGFDWTPRNGLPGTGGEGPHNVAWFRRDSVSRTERMDYMPCYAAAETLLDAWEQQHKTGDKIEILGGEGTRIVVQRWMPVDPNNNKTGDTNMKLVTEEVIVPEFPSLEMQTPALEYATQMAAVRKRQLAQRQLMADVEEDNYDEAQAKPLVAEVAVPEGAVASAGPVGKKSGKATR